MKKKNLDRKLVLNPLVVRTLEQTLTQEQLAAVAGAVPGITVNRPQDPIFC